jgi:hypothetical protein
MAACMVCLMPAPETQYAVRYEAGESPIVRDVTMHLCPVHAEVLGASEVRPVLEVRN